MNFYNESIENVFKELNSSENGIKESLAFEKQQKFGKNVIEKNKKNGFISKFFNQFKNIMIIILLISAIISILSAFIDNDVENIFEGFLILIIVILNSFVGVIQEQKAENAIEALSISTENDVKVMRDGIIKKIKVHELVVGDVVLLKTGDAIPADLRLFECNNLKCNESSLTGESHSISKKSSPINNKNVILSEQNNMCFSGTIVTSGSGKGIVTSVGKNTEMGKIASVLSSNLKEKTPLEKNIDKIGTVITFCVIFIAIIVFVVQVLLNKNITTLEALLTSVALAVAAIPESLPAVITIIMAVGVQKLARKNAIIKKLSAVETLGCCNVICSDKTGTLTKNEMSVQHICQNFEILNRDNFKCDDKNKLAIISSLCNSIIQNKNGEILGDATETSLFKFFNSQKIDVNSIKKNWKILNREEFSSDKKTMSATCSNGPHNLVFKKGALDYIINDCNKILNNEHVIDFTDELKQKIISLNESLCELGERVLAFSYQNLKSENDTIFVGFIGIADPPRKEAFLSIKECKSAGLKTIMITGDHPTTALSIAKKLGIAKSKKEVLTGSELNHLSQKELEKIIHNFSVFARVSPQHKTMIVKALKNNNKIVAMTGDGINDAPSVKLANIGVAMGQTGTDVTKEVADIIISDDNFSTIVLAIKEGRTIYHNIEKTILFLLSTNVVEVIGIFICSLVLHNATFLLPSQILFINLVTDSLPAFALGIEPPESDVMIQPPRNSSKSLLSGWIGTSIIYQGFVQSFIVLIMFTLSNKFLGNEIASTMSFLTICLMQIIHAVNCKTSKSIFHYNIFKNKFFNFSFIFLLGLILSVAFIPVLMNSFGLVSLSLFEWIIIVITSLSIIPLVEFGKIFIK